MDHRQVRDQASSRKFRGSLALSSIVACMLSLIWTSGTAFALPKEPDGEPGSFFCFPRVEIQTTLIREGLPLINAKLGINATNAKIQLTEPDGLNDRKCRFSFHTLTSENFSWELLSRPIGSSATLTNTNTLSAGLTPDMTGQYEVQFIACHNGCEVALLDGKILLANPATRSITIDAVDSLVLPPETEPILPQLPFTTQTIFPDSDEKCSGGGGVVDPQWVTTTEWHGPEHYELLEGRVRQSNITRQDNFLNHDSHDFLTWVETDPPFNRLRKESQKDIEVEWERDHFPEIFRPTRGDRASIVGYWILDCGHPPFNAEIHPPVMQATHRARAIELPSAPRPGTGLANDGLGSNIFVPGIVTDIWINQDAGEITRNCSLSGLHQPYGGQRCLPQGEGYDRNPINRIFEFNIYLPRDPQVILSDVGQQKPPVPLYREVFDPMGEGGPDPEIFVCPESGPNICDDVVIDVDVAFPKVTYLKIRIDLRSFAGRTYSRRIKSGWAYPAPDNWGIKRWKLRINSMNVHDDGDSVLRGDGDWRFWANTNNIDQEWTKLIECDGCVHGTESFDGRPWQTGSSDRDRSLGSDLLLFPEQPIWVHASGIEQDWVVDDSTGHVSDLRPQVARRYSTISECRKSGQSGCASYTLNYQVSEGQPIGQASLSQAGQRIYDAYVISAGNPFVVASLPLPVIKDWNHPENMIMNPDEPHVALKDTRFFSPQGAENLVLTGISLEDFQQVLSSTQQLRPELLDLAMIELREEVDSSLQSPLASEAMVDLDILLNGLPPNIRDKYFSDLVDTGKCGDLNDDNELGVLDVIIVLRIIAGVLEPNLKQSTLGDVVRDGKINLNDASLMLQHIQGLAVITECGPPDDIPTSSRIAFSSDRDGDYEIYVMDPDGSNQTRLTYHPDQDLFPAWSPDRTKIAFRRNKIGGNGEVFVMNADGSDQTNLTNNSSNDDGPTWSPDGTKIAFWSDRDGNWEIYVMNADGSNQTNLTNDPSTDFSPAWSPDGTKIAFASTRDGVSDIFVMAADGSEQTRLANTGGDSPAWSPDGTRIAFSSRRDGNVDIHIMTADGTAQTRLTIDSALDADPTWSPDGGKIAFWSDRDGNDEIYVMDADGSNQTNLTNNSGSDRNPGVGLDNVAGNRYPTARIIAPTNGDNFAPGAVILLVGEGTDPEDGELPPESLQWISDVDGILGNGPMLEVVLSGGGCESFTDHSVILEVTDNEGWQHTDTIVVRIGLVC